MSAVPATVPSTFARRRERDGVLLCLLAAACFAGTMIVAKLGHGAGVSVATLLAVRFAIAAAVLWLVAVRRGMASGLARRDALVAFLLGVLYAAQTGCSFTAVTRIETSLAELLAFTYPALVVIGAIALRHEAPSRRRLLALALAMGGVALVLAGAGAGALDPFGVACSLCGATLYAGYVLCAGRMGARLPALTFSALLCTGAAVTFVLVGGVTGSLQLAMGVSGWACALALALVSTVLAITAFLGGVARLGAGRASILAMLEPPLLCVLAFAVLGERLTALQLLGGALVVSAALVLELRSIRSRRDGPPAQTSDHPAAGALAHRAARRGRLGVRAEVGRLSRARVRRRERARDPVARR